MQISTISPSTFDDGKSVTLSGTGFGSSQGQVLIGGVAQNVNTWSDDEITFTTVRGAQSLGACRVDVVRGSGGTLVFSDNFDSYTSMSQLVTTGGWISQGAQQGGAISLETTGAYSGKSVKGSYPASDANGEVYVYLTAPFAGGAANELYISLRAKMPNTKNGCKFVKVFGGRVGGNYANCTFGTSYATPDRGEMYQVSFGDGSTVGNDTARVINFDGSGPNLIGRSYGVATVLTPQNAPFPSSAWGEDWHHFRFYVKFNSGTTAENEVPDGAFYVEIDGVVYVDATGLFNRHYSNLPIERVGFFNQSQGNGPAFDLWYDDIQLSTGGWA